MLKLWCYVYGNWIFKLVCYCLELHAFRWEHTLKIFVLLVGSKLIALEMPIKNLLEMITKYDLFHGNFLLVVIIHILVLIVLSCGIPTFLQ